MKFLVALMSLAAATAKPLPIYGSSKMLAHKDIKADSEIGQKLLSKARRVEQNDEIDFTWVKDYSIKFQGCHHITQWNEEANGDEDVRIMTKRLIRFRLCPTDSCSTENTGGCNSGYGDYILDMNTYLEAYFQSVATYYEFKCQYALEVTCAAKCGDGNDDQDYCYWDCLEDEGLEDKCDMDNPYNQDGDDEQEAFELEEYMECANWEPQNNNRRLDQNQVEYFMGPYCASQGGEILLGLFTDETCTQFADEYGGRETYSKLSYGEELPFGETSIIDLDCISCKEPEDFNNDGNDNQDEDEVAEVCEQIYGMAGKCETYMGIEDPNENACNYMEGIKIVRRNGVVVSNASSANKTASIFIGIFVVAFVLLAAYVYYLKTKLDRASINLSE